MDGDSSDGNGVLLARGVEFAVGVLLALLSATVIVRGVLDGVVDGPYLPLFVAIVGFIAGTAVAFVAAVERREQ